MQIRPNIHHRTPATRGSALAWTVGLLALAFFVQLALFVAIQGRQPATKMGTAEGNPPKPAEVLPPKPAPPPVVAVVDLPVALPPVENEPAPSVQGHLPLVARPVPVPAKPAPPRTAPPVEQTDPASIPREDVRVLVAEAVRLRRGGDMAGAVGKLNTALDILPGHPRIIFEMAATYEAMGMTDRALDNYRNVAEMGAARAGVLHPIAENRLKNGINSPNRRAADGDILFLDTVEEILQPGVDGQTVVLRCNVHSALGRAIDPAAVSLPVRFFDLVDGHKTEVSAAAPPQVHWSSPPVDWKEPGIETVEITCRMPASDPAEGNNRKYLGYMVELYYQDALLDLVARPRRLARFSESPVPAPELPGVLPDSLGGPLLE